MSTIIALQLYTIRYKVARDFQSILRRVAEIGYTAVTHIFNASWRCT